LLAARPRWAAIAALVAPLVGAMTVRETPITRVVTLIKDLSAKSEAEGKKEEDLYETFVCWAKSIIDAKTASNAAAEAKIEELSTFIKDIEAGRIEFTSEEKDLTKELKDLQIEIEAAEELRKKEHEEFVDAKAEMAAAATAIGKAIEVLEGATGKTKEKAAFLQSRTALATYSERQRDAADLSFAATLGSRMLSAGDAMFLRRVLTGDVPKRADQKKLNRKATFKMSYKARSTKIQTILKDMNKTFTDNLLQAEAKEAEAVKEHTALMKTKKKQEDSTKEALANMEKETGARRMNKEEAQEELDALTEQVEKDTKYIKQTEDEMAKKKLEWKDRKRLRAEELAAFSKAIEILYSDDARDLAKKSYASQRGASFLQVDLSAHRRSSASALRVLRAAAASSRDARLAEVAARVAAASGKGHFDEVFVAIDKMMQALKDEEDSDLAKKEQCEADRMENMRAAATKSRTIDEATELITRLTGEIAEIEKSIVEKTELIAKAKEELAEAKDLRKKENDEWKESTAEDEEMKAIIKSARDVLTKFYADNDLMFLQKPRSGAAFAQGPRSAGEVGKAPPPPPPTWEGAYGGQTEESANIISILEMAEEGVAKDIATAKAAEEEAASDFETFSKETKVTLEELAQAIRDMEEAKDKKAGDVHGAKSSRGNAQKELVSISKTITDAEPACAYIQVNFPVRQKARQLEHDGLVKAKAILSGGKFDTPDPDREIKPGDAFLQRRR